MPSTVVAFAHYDPDLKILEIGYRSGRKYQYFDVPQSEYDAFRHSGSKGRYLNLKIKNRYRYQQVGTA